MEIRRFFVTKDALTSDGVRLTGSEFEHMTRVLRYKTGYKAVVCANDGKELDCTVKCIGKDCALLGIDGVRDADSKGVRFTLYAGLLKNNKLDFAVQKAVELGVDRIIPFVSANCAETKFNLERAQKIALEAAKQCGAAYLTEVCGAVTFDKVLKDISSYDTVLFAYEHEKKHRIKDTEFGGRDIALVVGPEGGFAPEEAESAAAHGAVTVTLGRRILRAETADIVAAALALDALGELDNE